MRAALLLLGLAACAGPAAAGTPRSAAPPSSSAASEADLRRRVDCLFGQLEAQETGGERRRCAPTVATTGAPRAAESGPGAGATEPPPEVSSPPSSASGIRTSDEPPAWRDRLPERRGFVFGVGSGEDPDAAQRRALEFLARQLSVRVQVRSVDRQRFQRREVGVGAARATETLSEQDLSSTGRFLVRRNLESARVEEGVRTPDGRYHVLVSLDLAALRARQDALVGAALETLATALERLERARRSPALDVSTLVELMLDLDEVRNLGRSELGRPVAGRWAAEERRAERLLGATLGGLTATLRSLGEDLELSVAVEGQPVAGLPVRLEVRRGLVERLPESVSTDASGRARWSAGRRLAADEILVAARFEVGPGRLRRRLGVEVPAATLRVAPEAELVLRLDLQGEPRASSLRDALEGHLERRWGARLAPDAAMTAVARLDERPPIEVRGKVSRTVQLVLRGEGRLPLPEKRWLASGLHEDADEARRRAYVDLRRQLSSE